MNPPIEFSLLALSKDYTYMESNSVLLCEISIHAFHSMWGPFFRLRLWLWPQIVLLKFGFKINFIIFRILKPWRSFYLQRVHILFYWRLMWHLIMWSDIVDLACNWIVDKKNFGPSIVSSKLSGYLVLSLSYYAQLLIGQSSLSVLSFTAPESHYNFPWIKIFNRKFQHEDQHYCVCSESGTLISSLGNSSTHLSSSRCSESRTMISFLTFSTESLLPSLVNLQSDWRSECNLNHLPSIGEDNYEGWS